MRYFSVQLTFYPYHTGLSMKYQINRMCFLYTSMVIYHIPAKTIPASDLIGKKSAPYSALRKARFCFLSVRPENRTGNIQNVFDFCSCFILTSPPVFFQTVSYGKSLLCLGIFPRIRLSSCSVGTAVYPFTVLCLNGREELYSYAAHAFSPANPGAFHHIIIVTAGGPSYINH